MTFQTLHSYTKDLNILYIEDEKSLALQTAELLEIFFKSVTVCVDGKDGLDTYKEHIKLNRNPFDIILTDLNMPRMNGLDMIENILDLNPKQNIVVISAQDEVSIFLKLLNLRIDGFLFKPLQEQQLIQTLYKVAYNISNEKISLQYNEKMAATNEYLEREIQERTKELRHQLSYDHLTELKNRTALNLDLQTKQYNMIAILDIDRLQFINDLYGVSIGNQVIKQFSNYLINKTDQDNFTIYRVSGDEFAVCTNHGTQEEFINFISQLSESVIDLPLFINELNDELYVDVTIGLSCEEENLLTNANIALKFAKTNKKPFIVYEDSMNTLDKMQNTLIWKRKIQYALDNDNIVPVFQPIVNNKGEIVKYEALMRIKESTVDSENLITPYFFLDIAIQTKLYAKLSQMLISKALKYLIETDITISINLTYSDFTDQKLISLIMDALDNHDIGNRLIFEIVESEDIKDYELLQTFLQKFKKYGVKIAVDDFGSGYSNFGQIIKLKPDYMKIDGSLIKDIDKDEHVQAVVKAITQLAFELDVKLIAEFVHSKEVFETLQNYKIDEYQGYYFYEPLNLLKKEKYMV